MSRYQVGRYLIEDPCLSAAPSTRRLGAQSATILAPICTASALHQQPPILQISSAIHTSLPRIHRALFLRIRTLPSCLCMPLQQLPISYWAPSLPRPRYLLYFTQSPTRPPLSLVSSSSSLFIRHPRQPAPRIPPPNLRVVFFSSPGVRFPSPTWHM